MRPANANADRQLPRVWEGQIMAGISQNEIVQYVSSQSKLSMRQAREAVSNTLNRIKELVLTNVSNGRAVSLPGGFGTLKTVKASTGTGSPTHPGTRKTSRTAFITVGPGVTLKFIPSKALRTAAKRV